MHSNNRNTAKQGTTVTLEAAFYKDGVLTTPNSYGNVSILYGTTVISGGITPSFSSAGIGSISYAISGNATIGEYTDRWSSVVIEAGAESRDHDFTHNVIERDRQVPYTSGFCFIYAYLTDDAGTPLPNISGFAYVNTATSGYTDSPNTLRAVSDSSGRIHWEMPWTSPVVVDIPDSDIYKQVTVPSTPQSDILSL